MEGTLRYEWASFPIKLTQRLSFIRCFKGWCVILNTVVYRINRAQLTHHQTVESGIVNTRSNYRETAFFEGVPKTPYITKQVTSEPSFLFLLRTEVIFYKP